MRRRGEGDHRGSGSARGVLRSYLDRKVRTAVVVLDAVLIALARVNWIKGSVACLDAALFPGLGP